MRTGWTRWRRSLLVALAVAVLAVGAAAANMALLDQAGEERLGRLKPVDPFLGRTGTAAAAPAVTAPGAPVRGTATSDDDDAADDHGGSSTDDRSGGDDGGGRGRGHGGDDD